MISFDGPPNALSRSSERSFRCGSPFDAFLPVAVERGGCGVPFPAAAASLFGATPFATRGSSGLLLTRSPAIRDGRGGLDPNRRDASPRQCRLVARLLPGSSAKVSEGSRRPSAVSGMPLPPPNRRHGVPCLARCISPVAAVFSRLGTSDAVTHARAGFPRQTPDCSRRVRLPGLPGFPGSRP